MGGRDPRAARALGLWTASWLAVLLVAGLLWVGNLSVQWPVLLVPAAWALVAVRPRRRAATPPRGWEVVPAPGRTDTVERPIVRERADRRRRSD
jgi:hypothetical protein